MVHVLLGVVYLLDQALVRDFYRLVMGLYGEFLLLEEMDLFLEESLAL
jgi:hypothetical protein